MLTEFSHAAQCTRRAHHVVLALAATLGAACFGALPAVVVGTLVLAAFLAPRIQWSGQLEPKPIDRALPQKDSKLPRARARTRDLLLRLQQQRVRSRSGVSRTVESPTRVTRTQTTCRRASSTSWTTSPTTAGFLHGRVAPCDAGQLIVYCRSPALAASGPQLDQFFTGVQQLPVPIEEVALVISDNADIYGTPRDLLDRADSLGQ